MNLNEAQAERHGPFHAGLAEGSSTETKPTRPDHRRYFEALAWFDSPEDATEAKAAWPPWVNHRALTTETQHQQREEIVEIVWIAAILETLTAVPPRLRRPRQWPRGA
jgi:hypothetical protein